MQTAIDFQSCRARAADPATSHDAASKVQAFALGQYARILAALRELGAAGAEEIAKATGMEAYAARKRLPELEAQGLVTTTGTNRKTSTGRSERVWKAC